MASSFVIKNFLTTGKEDSDYAAKYEVATARLSSMLRTARTFNKLSVLDENGIVVASTEEDFVGSDKSAAPSFLERRKGTYIKSVHACKLTGELAMSIATPMVDNNELLGIMVAGMSLTELDEITTDRTGLGETGEIYLLNKDGYVITPSRFIDDTFLKQEVDTPESRECWELSGEEEEIEREVDIYESYRGKR